MLAINFVKRAIFLNVHFFWRLEVMENLFCTELPTSRETNKNSNQNQKINIPPLPLIEKKISNFAPPKHLIKHKTQQKKIKPRQKSRLQKRKIELHPDTKYILAHPTKLPHSLAQLNIVEEQLKILLEEYTKSEDFENSAHVQRILNSLLQKKRQLQSQELPCIRDENKKQELLLLVDNYIDHFNKSYENFMDVTDKQAAMIFDSQQREIEEFDENIPRHLTVQFKKPSSELLDMRRTEHKYAQQQKYNQAIRLKNEADQLEFQEEQKQMLNMKAFYMNKRQNLRQKQDDQLKVFFEHAEATRTKMISMRDKMIDGYMNRVKRIDENIDAYCQQTSTKKENIPLQIISKERMKRVKKAEKFPIPPCRPGTSFTKARQKLCQ